MLPLHFTDAERISLKRELEQRDRSFRYWKVLRWIFAFVAIFQVTATVIKYSAMQEASSRSEMVSAAIETSERAEQSVKLIVLHANLLRLEMRLYIEFIVHLGFSALFVVGAIRGWAGPPISESSTIILRRLVEAHDESPPDS